MRIPFWKMQGAGNDFVLVDDRDQSFPDDAAWRAGVAQRRTGVGCEGIILIQPSEKADFRMRFYNPDGTEVEMCGNGARCVARLAADTGVTGRHMSIDTIAGVLAADVEPDGDVVLRMTPPTDWTESVVLPIDGEDYTVAFVNTGVPHAVLVVDDVAAVDVMTMGRAIREHAAFAPAGTNADFIAVTGPNSIAIRTYERGVEDETLACGTGIVAGALVAGLTGLVEPPVTVTAASGDILTVDFTPGGDAATNVTLHGPARHVFSGELDYPGATG